MSPGESHSPIVTITLNPWIGMLFLVSRVVKLYALISFLKYAYHALHIMNLSK